MPIRFTCSNPACGHVMRAGDELAGERVRCPRCRTIQSVPAEPIKLKPLSEPPPAPRAAEQTSVTPGRDGAILCPDCGTTFSAAAQLCPQCGWVNSSLQPPLPARFPAPAAPGDRPRRSGQLAGDCLKAIAYGLSNFKSIFVLVLCITGIYFFFQFILSLFGMFLMFVPLGNLIMLALAGAVQLIIGGYFFRYYLDVIISSLEGLERAPDLPPFDISVLFATGVKGLGILVVYATPIITLPLLPLGFLAWAYSDDNRAFNVLWAVRAAQKRPGQLAAVWLMLLLWAGVGFLATYVITLAFGIAAGALTGSGVGGFLLAILFVLAAVLLAATVNVMFVCVLFRCVGMLGRHNPVLMEMLPESDKLSTTIGYVAAGIVVTLVMWLFVIPLILTGLVQIF